MHPSNESQLLQNSKKVKTKLRFKLKMQWPFTVNIGWNDMLLFTKLTMRTRSYNVQMYTTAMNMRLEESLLEPCTDND